MGKREILVGASLTCVTIGAGGVTAYLSDAITQHKEWFLYGSVGLIVFGLIGLAVLFFWPRKSASPERAAIGQSVSSNNQSGGITAWSVDKDTE
jgi:hypothetical protein